jgi:curved DNA-binding protein
MLTFEYTLSTFTGKVKLKVVPETQYDAKVKLKATGFPIYKKDGKYGDLIITFHIKMSLQLSDKEKELIGELLKLR